MHCGMQDCSFSFQRWIKTWTAVCHNENNEVQGSLYSFLEESNDDDSSATIYVHIYIAAQLWNNTVRH